MPVLGCFHIDPKLVEAFERLESLGTLPELATENVFEFLLYLHGKIVKKRVKQAKVRGC